MFFHRMQARLKPQPLPEIGAEKPNNPTQKTRTKPKLLNQAIFLIF